MGCGGINIRDFTKDPDKVDFFKNIENLLDKFEDAIEDYSNYKTEFEKLLYLKNRSNINLERYFQLNKRILVAEDEPIKHYERSYQLISKIDNQLNINPSHINLKPNLD